MYVTSTYTYGIWRQLRHDNPPITHYNIILKSSMEYSLLPTVCYKCVRELFMAVIINFGRVSAKWKHQDQALYNSTV